MINDVDLKKLKLNIQPHVLARLLSLNDSSDISFAELDKLVRADQNMAALILKAANSSLYSRGNEIKTLQHAISMLGFQIVRSLAMVALSQSLFEAGNYTRFKKFVWEHSMVVAIISRSLAERFKKKQELQEEAFIAGLLHDIGKIILNSIDRKMFIAVINHVTEKKVSFAEAETALFKCNHLDLGEQAVAQWNLPAVYGPILSMHKNIETARTADLDQDSKDLLYIVSYGNYLAKKQGFGFYVESDDKDGEAMESYLKISNSDRIYFAKEYPRIIANDEYYKFFMMII